MKKILLLSLLVNCCLHVFPQNVGIGTDTPDSNAILEIKSDTKGLLIPRMDSTARKAIPNTKGMMVYDTTTNSFWFNSGENWLMTVSTDGSKQLVTNGSNSGDMLYWDGSKWVLIPIGNEGEKLTVCNGRPVWGSCKKTFVLESANNTYEGEINIFYPNEFRGSSQYTASAWTSGGSPFIDRTMFKFDYSSIGIGAIIDSAKLFLTADHTPAGGSGGIAHSGTNNSFYIQRITSNWTLPTPFTWNNPPAVTTANQVIVPQSVSSFEDATIDLTQLIKDQLANGNNGFMMKLVNEVTYNIRQYCSSYDTDPTKRPKLTVYYHY